MSAVSAPRSWPTWAALGAIVALHGGLAFHAATRQSTTFDEVVYAPAGYARLAAGLPDLNPEHPPLVKLLLGATWLGAAGDPGAVPGLAERDEFRFGYGLLYADPAAAPGLLLRARALVVLLSAACVALVFAAAASRLGTAAGLFAAALYGLDPLAVAHAGLATLDVPVSVAILAALLASARAIERGGAGRVVLAGAACGAALASKATALALVPALVVVAAAPTIGTGEARGPIGRRLVLALGIAGVAVAALAILTLPEGLPGWLRSLEAQAEHARRGHATFTAGIRSLEAPWWSAPFTWAVKTPLPVLAVTGAGVALLARGARRTPATAAAMLAVPAVLGAAAMLSPLGLGARQLLPAVPFLAVAGGAALARAWAFRRARWLAPAAVAWLASGTVLVHPHELAYANEAAGGPRNLHRLLADSNVDWGQALPALARELEGRPLRRLWLDYWGSALPAAHGIAAYRRMGGPGWGPDPREDGPAPVGRELVAVSTTLLHDVYGTDRGAHAWLRRRTPVALPGYAIALFDVTDDAESYRALANTAERVGDVRSAAEAWRRALELGGPEPRVLAGLSRVFFTVGRRGEAEQACRDARALAPAMDPSLCWVVPRGE